MVSTYCFTGKTVASPIDNFVIPVKIGEILNKRKRGKLNILLRILRVLRMVGSQHAPYRY
jgi:hypothetical protein